MQLQGTKEFVVTITGTVPPGISNPEQIRAVLLSSLSMTLGLGPNVKNVSIDVRDAGPALNLIPPA
jgi:hypothetical protein